MSMRLVKNAIMFVAATVWRYLTQGVLFLKVGPPTVL